jgi:large subunit ribosomal protein L22e
MAAGDKTLKFKINLEDTVKSEVLKPDELASYLGDRIKVAGKVKNLSAGGLSVSHDSETVTVESKTTLSKRYLKYLTRRYLHSVKMAGYLRIIATGKDTYAVKLVKLAGGDDAAEE